MSGKLTDRQRRILFSLDLCTGWKRPMDIGGRDGSYHSAVLRQLVRKGMVERRPRNTLTNLLSGGLARGVGSSWEYKIAGAGVLALKNPLA